MRVLPEWGRTPTQGLTIAPESNKASGIVPAAAPSHPAPPVEGCLALTSQERSIIALRTETRRWLTDAAAWQWFVTLTFARDVSDAAALRAFRDWRTDIGGTYQAHVRIGWVHAPQGRDVQHLHALVAPVEPVTAPVSADAVRCTWKRGSIDVQPVYSAIGAVDYLLDHADLTADDIRQGWDLEVVCTRRPRCRRAGVGCRFRKSTP